MKNGFETRPLGDVCDVIAGQSPPSSTYNFEGRGLPFFQGKADFGALFPTTRVWCDDPTKIAEPNDILISVRAPVGPTNLCLTKACIGRGLSAIRAKNGTDFKYILYYLRSIEPQLSTQGRGSTFSAITQSEIRDLKLPYPPPPIQKQIATILEKADAAREKRRQANQLTEQFLQSAFLEMFGDPVRNDHGLIMKTLAEMCDLITDGKHGDCENEDRSGYYFISAKDIKDGRINYSEAREVTQRDFQEVDKRTNLRLGDILVTNSGTLGKVAIADDAEKVRQTTFQKSVAILKNRKEILNSSFLKVLLELSRNQLTRGSTGSSQKNLLLSDIKAFEIIAPSISEQLRFASLVEKVEGLREKQRESERELDNLFNSLMQRAFRGELVKES